MLSTEFAFISLVQLFRGLLSEQILTVLLNLNFDFDFRTEESSNEHPKLEPAHRLRGKWSSNFRFDHRVYRWVLRIQNTQDGLNNVQ